MSHTVLRTLVVDDQDVVRESICDVLELAGHTVCGVAGSGEEAVEMTERLRPDIVLMDIQMPGIGGIEAARQIRALPNPAPVVFLTALDDAGVSQDAADSGGFGYLVKPFHARQLGPVMRTAIERFQEWSSARRPSRTDATRQALAHFDARLRAATLDVAAQELLAAVGKDLGADGVALCLVVVGMPGVAIPAQWGRPLSAASAEWARSAMLGGGATRAPAGALGPDTPALMAAPLGATGPEGLLVACRAGATSFDASDSAVLEMCATGLGQALAEIRTQQPLGWRRWLHAARTASPE